MDTPTTIIEAAGRIRSGAMRVIDLVDQSLEAIVRHHQDTNAFVRVDVDGARVAAHALDAEHKQGRDRGLLHGIPISIKDLIDIAGQPTTAASRVLHDRIAEQDAPVVARLRKAGAVIIGKTNLHEFALGTTSEDSAFGPVRHPYDSTRSAGGSSGGSAAAVAVGMGLASIGTDTGGSIRIPAAACGVVGLKPTVGEVPTEGVVPLSFTLDHVGPLTRTVEDAAIVWNALMDREPAPVTPADPAQISLCRLAGYFSAPLEKSVREAFELALEPLRLAKIRITRTVLDRAETIPFTYVNIVLPEGAHWHKPYLDARADAYSPTVRARFQAGLSISAHDYLEARAARTEWRRTIDALLDTHSALVLPTLPLVAPTQGLTDIVLDPTTGEGIPVRTAMLKHTQLFNITGHPAISIPIRSRGLPVGMQIVGRRGDTPGLLAIAAACEKILA